jgi:hypothetical protein
MMTKTEAEKVAVKEARPGEATLKVILALTKTTQNLTEIGVNAVDYEEILLLLSYAKDTTSFILHGAEITSDLVNRGELNVVVGKSQSLVVVKDVWAILHPETATRFHRILWDEVI